MAVILHIETATKICSTAISIDGICQAVKDSDGQDYSHGEDLTTFINDVLLESGIGFSDLSAISISAGPGSYTGLRIGSATAKGLCFALNIPLIAIDSLVCLSEIVKSKYPGLNRCPVIDARRMEVYNCVYSESGEALKAISADIINENTYLEFDPMVVFGDGAEKLMEIWNERSCTFDLGVYSSAKGQVDIAFKMFKNNEFVDLAYWEPHYLKDFVAGVKLKNN
jgi:tRNA threonylcarbamoyladenosine biosynthesis protein TsaB